MLRQQFSVQHKLGDALYGSVWLAEDACNKNACVAVKQVSLSHARRALSANRNLDNPWDERRTAAAIMRLGGHDNILRFETEFVESGSWFIVMEFCDGGDLLDLLQATTGNRLNESAALECMRQVVRGVQFLHTNGIAHRDLSLENVLLLSDGTCKISDFGLSTETNRMCDERVGKAYYMAPEVVAERTYDAAAADMWSLGIMLFILLTGSPLTPSASDNEKAFRALKTFGVGKILEAWGMRDDFAPSTVELLEGLLQADPAKRFTIDDVVFHASMQLP